MSATRSLFGGAIQATFPSDLLDAADIRQIPDTQEVYLSPTSDVSYVVEILQSVEPQDLEEAARFHFTSLAHDNDAQSSLVEAVKGPESVPSVDSPAQPHATLLRGTQLVRKFNRPTADEVRILLALFRVEDKAVDLLITVNIPVINGDGTTLDPAAFAQATKAFDEAVQTFKIVDFSLFA